MGVGGVASGANGSGCGLGLLMACVRGGTLEYFGYIAHPHYCVPEGGGKRTRGSMQDCMRRWQYSTWHFAVATT